MSFVMMALAAITVASNARAMGGVKTEEAEVMLSQFILAMNQRLAPRIDAAKAADLYSGDAVLVHPFGSAGEQRGQDAIRTFFAGLQEQWSAITHVESSRTVQGGRAVWEGTAVAVSKASGDQVRMPVVLVLMFGRDGKVTRARVYQDDRAMAQAGH
jgi:ketosteroid isomerase-like protein